jgi:putative acetyltransferase
LTVAIRAAHAGDAPAVDALLRASFPAPAEAELVARLARDGDIVLVLVATDEGSGELLGVIVFSRMAADLGGRPVPAVALAPLAVARDARREGIADLLVRAGLDWLRDAGVAMAFVLGNPDYYGRFGFEAALAEGFASPYAGPHFMATVLAGGCLEGSPGEARHAEAFAALSS